MDKFDSLVSEVAAVQGVVASAISLIDKLVVAIADAKDDPEQIAAIVAGLKSQREALAAAVTANSEPSVQPVE